MNYKNLRIDGTDDLGPGYYKFLHGPIIRANSFINKIGGKPCALLFIGALITFSLVAFVIGLPGADGDTSATYNVITYLANSLTYKISRLPGQPFLDYCNFISWTIGGDLGVQVWFIIISALGISSFYYLVREADGSSPLIAALTLGLHPFFLTHVGGLGDFSVSLSFLIISLLAGAKGWIVFAGLTFALSVGCRLSMCIYVFPLMVLIGMTYQKSGATLLQSSIKGVISGGIAAFLSLLFYAPLFSFYGWQLLNNFPMKSIAYYHIPAFLYHLFVGFGIIFWIIIMAWLVAAFYHRRDLKGIKDLSGLEWTAILLIVLGLGIFFRVPTKPDLILPILVGCIIIFQRWASPKWAVALLVSSVAVGVLSVSPYDRYENHFGLNLQRGWYAENLFWAHKKRLDIKIFRNFLGNRPGNTILLSWFSWSQAQAEKANIIMILNYRGIKGLKVFTFPQLVGDKVIVDFHEKSLPDLLKIAANGNHEGQTHLLYESFIYGLVLRHLHIDLSKFGKSVVIKRNLLKDLWKDSGHSIEDVVSP